MQQNLLILAGIVAAGYFLLKKDDTGEKLSYFVVDQQKPRADINEYAEAVNTSTPGSKMATFLVIKAQSAEAAKAADKAAMESFDASKYIKAYGFVEKTEIKEGKRIWVVKLSSTEPALSDLPAGTIFYLFDNQIG